jgi:hypothetical protein
MMPEYELVSNDILCNFTSREVELPAPVMVSRFKQNPSA